MPVHPNSLANLQPFKHGYDPRRCAARPLGATYVEWLNVLGDEDADGNAKFDEDTLRAIAGDPKAPAPKRFAAKTLLRGYEDGWSKATPLAANDLDRVCDRTLGKPTQTVHLRHSREPPLEELEAELVDLLQRNPDVARELASRLPVDVVARLKVLPAGEGGVADGLLPASKIDARGVQ